MNFKKIFPFVTAVVVFAIISIIYFSPVLEGKEIYQSDIVQFTGMSKEIQDHRAETEEELYWTDAAFGGMPAYQVSAYYPNNFLKYIDKSLRFLPRPADYLFLYFLGFFVLMTAFKVDWRIALLGAMAFGFTTYYIVILGVGHNAKAHAIAYFSFVLAGVIWTFRGKLLLGFVVTTLASALEIATGHVQMTYYLLILLLIYGVYKLVYAIKDKQVVSFAKQVGVLIAAALLAAGMNANHLLPTMEYSKESTRSISELTLNPDGSEKDANIALDRDYITEYSYGVLETMNLFIPRFMGGGNAEDVGTDSHTYRLLKNKIGIRQAKDFASHAPTYWGNQPIVAAPAYIGAIWIFLMVMSLSLINKRRKYWLLTGLVLTLLLSWGKNFSLLTDFFINYIPLYHKFRAVSSIQVIVEWIVPILALLGLQRFFFNDSLTNETKEKALKNAFYITGGLALFFVLLGKSLFAFEGAMDAQYEQMLPGFTEALVMDRKHMFFLDSIRTFVLILLSASVLWLFLKKKLKLNYAIIVLGLLLIFDVFQVAKRYVNSDDFVQASQVNKPFAMSEADKAILQDKSHYRVANFSLNPLNDGSTSYFHKSIGGYHAAKPRRYQELFDYQVSSGNYEVLNMLHAKYLILNDETGNLFVEQNDSVYGNAWFAYKVKWAKTADEEIQNLTELDGETAILDEKYKSELPDNLWLQDSTATIALKSYAPNKLVYQSHSRLPQLAMFSEMYYPHGWKAMVDGKPYEILRANYVLRALVLPEGSHEIIFSFEPEVVKKGAQWSLWSYLLFFVLTILGVFLTRNHIAKRK